MALGRYTLGKTMLRNDKRLIGGSWLSCVGRYTQDAGGAMFGIVRDSTTAVRTVCRW